MRTNFLRRTTYLLMGTMLIGALQLGSSAGGAQHAVAPRTLAPGDHMLSLMVGNQTRVFLLHMPSNTTARRRPLILVFHGANATAKGTENVTDFNKISDKTGEVVAYLQGVNNHWNEQANQNNGSTADDVAYTSAVINMLIGMISFDPNRIIAVGFSNGALMVEDLGCKLARALALIVPVEGEIAAATSPGCRPSRPIRVYEIHGTKDTEIFYDGGPIGGNGTVVLSAPQSVHRWARLDHCSMTPTAAQPFPAIKLTAYTKCRKGVSVVLRTLVGGVHQWTGGIGEIVASIVPPA